ncbi:MAG: acyl-CoA dehydrogenase family protein, partial [Pseudomonadota bacterium]
DAIRLWGRKWMVAAPMGDIVLSLCLTQDGPTAVAIPRFDPENMDAIRIERMLALGGLASQAVVALGFDGAVGTLVGDPGRGFQVLRDVRTLTQLDGAVVMAGGMRGGLARAVHHARYHRRAGKALIDDPLHARVLSDLALECAAHTALAMRLASAFDMAFERDGDHAVARLVTPAARIYATKTAAAYVAEVAELIGENTVLAEHPAARILADLVAYARWEGTTSEAALDIAAMVERDENVLREALDELGADLGDQHADLVDEVRELGQAAGSDTSLARAFAEQLAMLAAASAMRRNLPRVVSDAYIATRLRERFRVTYGALDGRLDATSILDFIVPED